MKKILLFVLLICGSFSCKAQNTDTDTPVTIKETFFNPLGDGADPWVIKVGDKYYTCRSTGRSLVVTESRFLSKVEKTAVVWSAPNNGWCAYNVWAPELHFLDGKWYIYFAASPIDGSPFIHQRSGVVECDTPLGQYKDKGVLYTGDDDNQDFNTNIWAIDVNVFELRGKRYAVWSGWEKQEITDQTAQHTYIAEMLSPTKLGKRSLISVAEESWELGEAFGLQEGQETLFNNDGDLFVVYSTRGSWTKYYRLGYLKLKKGADPLLESSWTKSKNQVFEGNATVYGVGHASFTVSPDGKENWIYYHTKKQPTDGWDRDVRLQPFTFDGNGNPYFGEPVKVGELKPPSGEIDIDKK